jgi:NADH dehydrogenase
MQKKILILGAGFGGVRAALDLSRRLGKDAFITIVDKNNFHSCTPDYYEIASAVFAVNTRDKENFHNLAATVAIPLSDIFSRFKNVRVVTDEVNNIELAKNQVVLKSGEELPYDSLIIALGSESAHFDIPHLYEYAHDFKTVYDALNVRDAIDEAMYKVPKHEKVKILIAGGGFTGCELAAELVGFLHLQATIHSRPRNSFEAIIVESGKNILSGAGSWAISRASKRIGELGVQIIMSAKIAAVASDTVTLDSGKTIAYDVLVWTAGVRANSIAENILGVKIAGKGCLATDNYLRILGSQNVFVLGDAAYCVDPETEGAVPMTAQTAIHQGEYVAYTISRMLRGRRTFSYIPIKTRFIIPLGGRYALFSGTFIKVAGLLPWLMKQFVSWNYLSSILPWHKALLMRRRAVKIYLRNDE